MNKTKLFENIGGFREINKSIEPDEDDDEFRRVRDLLDKFEIAIETNVESIEIIRSFEKNSYRLTLCFFNENYLLITQYEDNYSIGNFKSLDQAEDSMNKSIEDLNNNLDLIEGSKWD